MDALFIQLQKSNDHRVKFRQLSTFVYEKISYVTFHRIMRLVAALSKVQIHTIHMKIEHE